jgi:hypothetical protein
MRWKRGQRGKESKENRFQTLLDTTKADYHVWFHLKTVQGSLNIHETHDNDKQRQQQAGFE